MTQTALDLWNDKAWLLKRYKEQLDYIAHLHERKQYWWTTAAGEERYFDLLESAGIQKNKIIKRLEYLGIINPQTMI